MFSLPVINPPAIVQTQAAVQSDATVVPPEAVAELCDWLDQRDAIEREEIERTIDQMEAAEMQDDPGRFQFDAML